MSMYFQQFYLKYGIRVAGQLLSPPLTNLELLSLPKQSILHYVTVSPVEVGPASDEFIFRNITRPIMMDHVIENGDNKGNPRPLSVASGTMIRTYHIKHRRFRIMRELTNACKDANTLVIFNYGVIPRLYRYLRSYYTAYYKWWNTETAVWKKIAEVAGQVDRNQFILYNLPNILPSIADLRLASKGITQKTIKIFNSPESLSLLELWKWVGPDRKESALANVPDDKLDKVNIIFQESGKFFVVNLGRLNRWRVATKEELELNPDANTKGIDPKQLQMRFLRLMMALFQVRTAAAKLAKKSKIDTIKTTVIKQDVTIPEVNNSTTIAKDIDKAIIAQSSGQEITDDSSEEIDYTTEVDVDETITADDELDKEIEAELSELETISINHHGDMNDDGDKIEDIVIVGDAPTLEDGVLRVCDRLADMGMMSASEYKKLNELSKTYRSIVAPNGKETLDKFIDVNPESLKIESSHSFKDIPTVIDKSMLKSSLHDFDKKYISNVLEKDIAGMVVSIQNAGVILTGYDKEVVEDVMGDYELYTVKVKPVEGMPSIMRYKLPVIGSDGTYTSNGVKYKLRRQRGDLPIRKVSPDTVALTSYYSKTFISRSDKKVNDYCQWLKNNITVLGLDNTNLTITKLYTGNVFDNQFTAPRVYNSLAQNFRGFTANSGITGKETTYVLNFDHTERLDLYGKEAIEAYEKDGAIIVGLNTTTSTKGIGPLGTNIYLVMDSDGALYTGNNGDLVDLCSIEDLLGLDAKKAPVDHAELKVMGREIPIGIILGYELGLSRLIKLLGVVPRRVNTGTRVNLESHEYSLVFSDETLVFSKDDRKASIILAGFNEYHKAIIDYGVYDFDKPSVYLNVLETDGASTKYLREIDLMYQMFIDPITKELLREMKEPTTFHGLLIRSCELLLTEEHPDELDPSHMRIKGYERVAGVVYTEMVKAIRAHNAKPGKGNKQIELNPYAVWMSLRQDPAVVTVNDINPIQNLKETEAVTYSGTGGRNSRSMTKRTRLYHKNDMGTISEATVDSSDVAINTFTSADPQFTNLRGMTKGYTVGESGATALLSTSALNAPGSDMDDYYGPINQ